MTQKEREEIFSKEVLTADDMCKLFEVAKPTGYQIIREIKARCDRLHIKGVVHVQDYIDYYRLPQARFVFGVKKEKAHRPVDTFWWANAKRYRTSIIT